MRCKQACPQACSWLGADCNAIESGLRGSTRYLSIHGPTERMCTSVVIGQLVPTPVGRWTGMGTFQGRDAQLKGHL
jgi:hypothetical protein